MVDSITRESLVDMFASLSLDCRQRILAELEKSIPATEEDATSGSIAVEDILDSYRNLVLMQECCKQAQEEFLGLSKKVKA